MSLEDRVVRRVQRWAPRFVAGELKDRGLFRPPYEPGERFACKLPHAAFQRLPGYAPAAAAQVDRRQPATGLVYATDRRVLLADRGRVSREWRWTDLARVEVVSGFVGALLARDRGDAEVDGLVDVERPAGFDLDAARYPARWVQLEACHAAAHDRLDDWLAALPGRLA